ncbi:MAG: hypothetical protein R3A10_10450 [Caldilineaceae bacterium]
MNTALVAAGSVSYADALRLCTTRGRLMKEAGERNPGMMAAILGLDDMWWPRCAPRPPNGGLAWWPTTTVRDRSSFPVIARACSGHGGAHRCGRKVRCRWPSASPRQPVDGARADALRSAIEATPVQDATVPLLANTSAMPITKSADIRTELTAQLTGSVRWTESMQYALAQGMTHFVELGAGDVLATLMKRIDRKVERRAVNNVESVLEFVATVGV